MHLKDDLTQEPIEGLNLKLRFAAVDLAPNVQLETGFSVLDRERTLIRMEKLYRDEEMVGNILNLGPSSGTIAVIDMPKSLSIPSRWRQEEVKMHPQRLQREGTKPTDRFEARGRNLYDQLTKKGVLTFLYFNYWTRLNYGLLLPFRSRSPQGCRALQTAISQKLEVRNMPTNLAPSSVLESIVGAYASWSVWAGKPGEHYEIYKDELGYLLLIPKKCPRHKGKSRRNYRRRR